MELITNVMSCGHRDFAKQLSIYEWTLFFQIPVKELLEYSKKGIESSPSIKTSIAWFNNLSRIIVEDILKPDIKTRVEIIVFWIKVAFDCKKLNNLNGIMEIMSALSSSPISRLKKTWLAIPKEFLKLYQKLEKLVSNEENYKEYRIQLDKICQSKSPAVPYLGIFLRDAVFIEENSTTLTNGTTNYFKVNLERKIYSSMIYFQLKSYKMSANSGLQKTLDIWRKNRSNLNNEEALYEKSVSVEPIVRTCSVPNLKNFLKEKGEQVTPNPLYKKHAQLQNNHHRSLPNIVLREL